MARSFRPLSRARSRRSASIPPSPYPGKSEGPNAMNAAARLVEVRVPDMGNFKDVAVIDVLVKPGESIQPEAPLVTLETEKATMDVPTTASGVIEKVHVAKGGKVSAGDLIATVRSEAAPESEEPARATPAAAVTPVSSAAHAAPPSREPSHASTAPAAVSAAARPALAPAPAEAPRGQPGATPTRVELPPINEPGFSRAHAGPSVRKFARELGVDLTRVAGHGFKGRITHDDVKAFVKTALGSGAAAPGAVALPAIPAVDFSQFGPTEVKPLSRIQRISGPRLHASWVNIPHVTQFDEADITGLEETRTKLKDKASQAGIKLTPLAFIMRACVKALQEFPQFNASLDRKSTRLNSSHDQISYAVFCLKKKNNRRSDKTLCRMME